MGELGEQNKESFLRVIIFPYTHGYLMFVILHGFVIEHPVRSLPAVEL